MAYNFEPGYAFAHNLDDMDTLFSFRERFHLPLHNDKPAIYFCGNSLGLQPKSTAYLFEQELKDWAKLGVEGHFQARAPWFYYANQFSASLARIIGCLSSEVMAMNTLTVNLHLLLLSFYKPTSKRHKIIMEAGAFPSDQYAIETQVRMHGFNPEDAIIELKPAAGAYCLEEDAVLTAIQEAGDELACVLMGGVNYYTGQLYDMASITQKAHEVGALAGFDLAHATGNVPMSLHDWDVDFACMCSYKYLNSGPGGVGAIYVHEKWGNDASVFRLAGWWGNDETTRFEMKKGFSPAKGAAGWQMSNAPVFNMIGLRASLDIMDNTSMKDLHEKSQQLTAYLEYLLKDLNHLSFTVITPKDLKKRGAQLSMLFHKDGRKIFDVLTEAGVIADWREPDVIRVAPVPLYNTYSEVYRFYQILKELVV